VVEVDQPAVRVCVALKGVRDREAKQALPEDALNIPCTSCLHSKSRQRYERVEKEL